MNAPKYYFAVFGKPEPPEKDTPDSGRFFLGKRGADTPGERGDILLLCCPSSYAENFKIIPGIGIVLTKTKESIFYRYIPFASPASKETIDRAFTESDRNKIADTGLNAYWIFDISRESFANATKGISINWP